VTDYVTIELTPSQVQSLAPIVQAAAAHRQNVLFMTVSPDCVSQEWNLQVVSIPASKASKLLKAIRAAVDPEFETLSDNTARGQCSAAVPAPVDQSGRS
jgi:hypothetical protein